MTSRITGEECGITGCDRPLFKDQLCASHWRLAAMHGAVSASQPKEVPWDSALLLINNLAGMVDELSQGLEELMELMDADFDMERIMLPTLTLTNTARRFVAEHG